MGDAYKNVPVGSAFNDKQTRDGALYTVLSYYEQAVDPVPVDDADGQSLRDDLPAILQDLDGFGFTPLLYPLQDPSSRLNETLERARESGLIRDTSLRTEDGYVITDRGRVTVHELRHQDHDSMVIDQDYADLIDTVVKGRLGDAGREAYLE